MRAPSGHGRRRGTDSPGWGRGRPHLDDVYVAAAGVGSGVVTGASAAAALGWELKLQPGRPTVTVPAKRRVSPRRRDGVAVRWRDIDPDDVWNGVPRPGPALVDCAKTLPFDEALAVADSALRHDNLTPQRMMVLARQVSTTGRAQCLRVAREATALSANPFEFHGRRRDLVRDCERYNTMVLRGWTVSRFS